jgi:hypothetical protein
LHFGEEHARFSTTRSDGSTAGWYRAWGFRSIGSVVACVTDGKLALQVFCIDFTGVPVAFSTAIFSAGWKQHLGFADSFARKQAAVERTMPFIGLADLLFVFWAICGAYRLPFARPALRFW